MSDELPIDRLKKIVHRLRSPGGCPWDIKQTPQTLTPHIIEEAYEIVDAIETNDPEKIKDELSDSLLHITMLAEILSETSSVTFDEIATHCCEKMIRRHPHVFGDKTVNDSAGVNKQWEELKLKEQNSKDLFNSIPKHFPALLHAQKIQKKVSYLGFDWPSSEGAIDKLMEECNELKDATSDENITEELGDILFSLVNICRKYNKSAEDLLQKANQKFKNRFNLLNDIMTKHNKEFKNCTLEELEQFWNQAKKLSK